MARYTLHVTLLNLFMLNLNISCLCSVDPDQMASEEANWSGSALFITRYVNLYQQSGSSDLIGWKLEVGMASLFRMTKANWKLGVGMASLFRMTRANILLLSFVAFLLQTCIWHIMVGPKRTSRWQCSWIHHYWNTHTRTCTYIALDKMQLTPKMPRKPASENVAFWIFLQTFQTYFWI